MQEGGRIIVKVYNNEMPCLNVNKGFTIRCKPLACSEKTSITLIKSNTTQTSTNRVYAQIEPNSATLKGQHELNEITKWNYTVNNTISQLPLLT